MGLFFCEYKQSAGIMRVFQNTPVNMFSQIPLIIYTTELDKFQLFKRVQYLC